MDGPVAAVGVFPVGLVEVDGQEAAAARLDGHEAARERWTRPRMLSTARSRSWSVAVQTVNWDDAAEALSELRVKTVVER